MDAESNLTEKITVSSNSDPTPSEPIDPAVLKEKVADELKSAATMKGGGDGLDSPPEKDDLLEQLDRIEASSEVVKPAAGGANPDNDVDMENDDLIQRLEAMEKGDEEETASNSGKMNDATADVAHQNGLEKSNEADSLSEEEKPAIDDDKMDIVDGGTEKKDDVSSSDSAAVGTTTNGGPDHEQPDEPSSSVKRRHSEDEEAVEPSSKKLHVEESSTHSIENPVEKNIPVPEKPTEKIDEPTVESDKTAEPEKVEESPTENEQSAIADKTVEKSVVEPELLVEEKSSITDDKSKAETHDPAEESVPPPGPDPVDLASPEIKETPDNPSVVDIPSPDDREPKETTDSVAPASMRSESEEIIDEEKLLESDSKSTESDVDLTSPAETEKLVESESIAVDQPQEKTETEQAEQEKKLVDQNPESKEVVSNEKPDQTSANVADNENVEDGLEVNDHSSQDKQDNIETAAEVQPEKAPVIEETSVLNPPPEDVPKTVEKEDAQPEPSCDPQQENEVEPKSESLPDTEPNTEPKLSPVEEQPSSSLPVSELKNENTITSSSEPKEPVETSSTDTIESAEQPTEADTVTSSDEKPSAVDADPVVEVDSTPEVEVAVPAVVGKQPEESDEAMEVDVEPTIEEPSQVAVSEAPCIKKQAFECTDKDDEEVKETTSAQDDVVSVPSPKPAAVASNPIEKAESMEVDSDPVPTQSGPSDGDVTESMNTTSDEAFESLDKADSAIVADSQSDADVATTSAHNKNLDATARSESESKVDTAKLLDDSIECSLPTSSSDKLADRLKQRLDMISNGSSTPNTAVSSSNVYNSTPIQKQFEISSENVSKITRHSVDNSQQEEDEHSAIVADNSTVDEKDTTVASTSGVTGSSEMEKETSTATKDTVTVVKDESSLKTTESSEVDSCTASSALNTADETNMYATNARKFNGISSTSGSELDDKSGAPSTSITTAAATTTTTVNKLDLTAALTSEEALYEVSVWFEGTELQFLSVERLEHKSPPVGAAAGTAVTGSTHDLTDSSKQSSNGSVGSLGPFSLPPPRPAIDSAMSHSSTTESSSGTSHLKASLSKSKHTVRGAKALASLMVEEFTKIKRALGKDDDLSDAEPDKSTAMKTPKGRPSSAAKKTTAGRKRTHSDVAEEEEPKAKQSAKQAKKGQKSVVTESPEVDETPKEDTSNYLCCLARWSDRKYYAGKVTGFKGDNKYMVLFEDGASKALSKDVIVIGDKDTLPIKGHSVHALTGGDTYEPGFVQEIKRNEDNEVVYAVLLDEGTVEVTASDLYLTEEQAKAINKACKALETGDELQSPQSSGKRGGSAANTPLLKTPDEPLVASAEKGSRSTRSKRGGDKPQTPVTPEAGYSGGVAKKGRRGRRLS
ncbi:titin-like isoform X2 [Malaya genurostris]|uniref:titin-like isoform X2 n=1 Tax=Malaya genurostris TaxID=325434 RepID=UPI0026F3B821|nr:titin-like isoform X2 [Malaya genurostris]